MTFKNLFIWGMVMFSISAMFSSCDLEVTDVYHYRIVCEQINQDGLKILYDYVDQKGVFTGDKTFTSQSERANDMLASDLLDRNIGKIQRAELKAHLDQRKWIYRTDVIFYYIVESSTHDFYYERDYKIPAEWW